jgi:hypothetical protein
VDLELDVEVTGVLLVPEVLVAMLSEALETLEVFPDPLAVLIALDESEFTCFWVTPFLLLRSGIKSLIMGIVM